MLFVNLERSSLTGILLGLAVTISACAGASGEGGTGETDDEAAPGDSDENSGEAGAGNSGPGNNAEIEVPDTVPLDAEMAQETVQNRLATTLDAFVDTAVSVDETANLTAPDMTVGMMESLEECGGVETIDFDFELDDALSSLEGGLRDFSDALKNDVFREDLIESDDGTTVVYWMDPAKVCDVDDLTCQQDLAEHPVRLSVTSHEDDSLRVQLLVGEERNNPANLVLTDDSFEMTADLAELLDVLKDIVEAEDLEALPDSLTGLVELALIRNSAENFSFELSILEPLAFSEPMGDLGGNLTASWAAAPEALRVGLDGAADTVSVALDFKAFDISVPGETVCEGENCSAQETQGAFNAHLGGLSFATTLQDGASMISVTNIGLGDDTSQADVNGAPLVAMDLNPDAGRRFEMQVVDVEGGTQVNFEPKLDFKLATTLLNLSEGLRADLPEWLYNEIFEVTLGGDARASVFVADDCATTSQLLEVTEGSLRLSATSLASDVVVEAGMCLFAEDTAVSDDPATDAYEPHPFESYVAGVCE